MPVGVRLTDAQTLELRELDTQIGVLSAKVDESYAPLTDLSAYIELSDVTNGKYTFDEAVNSRKKIITSLESVLSSMKEMVPTDAEIEMVTPTTAAMHSGRPHTDGEIDAEIGGYMDHGAMDGNEGGSGLRFQRDTVRDTDSLTVTRAMTRA